MKTYEMANIGNVIEANDTLHYLLNRKRTEMVGLGLFYGAPGLGKSRWAKKTCFGEGNIYLPLTSTMTQKSFLQELYMRLCYKYEHSAPKGSKNDIFNNIINVLLDAPNTVIFIDEIDYGFQRREILHAIRDIVDLTVITIVLVGMQDAYHQLLKLNAHYFDRCNAFCEFKPLTKADTKLVINQISDITMDEDIVKYVHEQSGGTLRKTVKQIDYLERLAKEKKVTNLTLADLEG